MIEYIQKFLERLGKLETKHFYLMSILVLLFTGFMLIGATRLQFESDFDAFNPKDLEVIKTSNRISDKFSSPEPIVILVEIDDSVNNLENPIIDIRDPRVIKFVKELESNLKKESKINEIRSAAAIFPNKVPETLEQTKTILNQVPQSSSLFNPDYSFTIISLEADIGFSEEKIRDLNNEVLEIIESSSKPGGIKTSVTGTPPLIAVMFNLLINDAIRTLIYATIFIFLLLMILTRSLTKSAIIIIPLLFGLTWTIGTLGWTNTPVTIATAGLSAMLLGLGVEYSIFLFSRYEEERKNKPVNESIIKSLSTTGASTTSSGLTTIIGFGVLAFSIFPVLSDLGLSLATGITYALTSTMIVLPLSIIVTKKIFKSNKKTNKKNKSESRKNLIENLEGLFEKYGSFVSKKTLLVIFIGITGTIIMFFGIQYIKNQEVDFDTVLPQDLEELEAFNKIFNQFPDTSSVTIFIELEPTEPNSNTNQPEDIRNPDIVNYIDILSQKAKNMNYFESLTSLSEFEKQINNNQIPQSLAEQKNLLQNQDTSSLITKDLSGTIIRINLNIEDDQISSKGEQITRELKELIETTEKPQGIKTIPSGSIIVNTELNQLQNPDTARTSIFALIGIIVLLLLLSRSIKYTILPLLTVVLAIIWTLGLTGYTGVPFNNITSSVITLTIGIGIDFGLQLSIRFRQELENKNKKATMTSTLKNTLYPMTITVIAAVIGFSTMRLGDLKLMGDLGTTMSFSIVSSMIVAITVVAGLILIFERKK